MKRSNCEKVKSMRKGASKIASLLLVFVMLSASLSNAALKKEIVEPTVNAGSYIVMSASTSEIVYEEHAERKLPIGAITKFMTAMVVLDNMHDTKEYENVLQISRNLEKYGKDFKKGESITVEDLLTAMLVGNSDEAAEALARYSASSRKIFVGEMNSKAMELGLISTQFTNPTGAYDPDHYSTAEEAAYIVQAAIRYDEIKKLSAYDTKAIQIIGNQKKKIKNRSLTFTNTNQLLSSNNQSKRYQYIKGGIEGSLSKPRRYSQYAGVATKDDMQLVVILLEGNEDTLAQNAIDLFEYGYSKVTKNTIVKAGKCLGKAKVKGGAITKVKGYTENKGFAYIPPEGSTDLLTTEVFMYDNLVAPLRAGQKVGEFRIYVADELKGTVDLVTKKEVKKGWFPSKLYISNFATVMIVIIGLLIAFFTIRHKAGKKRRAKLKERERQAKIRQMAMEQEALEEDRRKRNWTYGGNYENKDINDKL